MHRPAISALVFLALAAPVAAKDSLGVFGSWGAFRDASVPRCYAIAEAAPSSAAREFEPYATVASWPARRIRGQVHFRLSRARRDGTSVIVRIGGRNYPMTGGKADAWARDATVDAAIVAAIRSADSLRIYATDARGRRFSDNYALEGAATAIDAATIACAPRR